jgi:hypothetical protein
MMVPWCFSKISEVGPSYVGRWLLLKNKSRPLLRRELPNTLTKNRAGHVTKTGGGTEIAGASTEDDWHGMKTSGARGACTKANI